jgi:uncharacterized protein involved in exopolysaccharide biosynthesis
VSLDIQRGSPTDEPVWQFQIKRSLLLTRWKTVFWSGLIGATVAAATVLLLPSYYTAGAGFQAEASASQGLNPSSLAGLATQIGGLQLGGSSNAQFFADLLSTDAVLRPVASAPFPWKTGSADLATIYGYDGDAPGWREFYTVRKLRDAIKVSVNVRTGVVRFGVEARTPILAKAIAETILVALNNANVLLRQNRAGAERSFSAERAEHSRQELADAEQALAAFYRSNRLIANSPTLQMEEARLRRAVEMAQQVYVQLRLQQEQAAVQEVRNTPTLSVVDPPLLPVKRSWPNRRTSVLLGLVLGLALGVLRVSFSRPLPTLRTERES